MKTRLIILVLLAAVALAAYFTHGFGFLAPQTGGPLTLYGNVDIRSVDLGFRVPGRVASVPVDEGARIETGTILAQLDTKPLTDMLNAAEAQVSVAAAERDKRRSGNRPQDIAQAEATVAERRASLVQTSQDFDRRSQLFKNHIVSQAQYDLSEAQFRADEARLAAAEQSLSLMRAGFRKEDVASADAQYAVAVAQRDKAQTDLTDATLKAPSAGTILTRAREPGAIVQAGESVFTLTIDRPMRVRAYISEPDLGRISPGMEAQVKSDGNQKLYRGTIGFISPTAEFTPKSVQTESLRTDLVYRLRIIVTDPDDALRQGQPVTVIIPDARPAGGR